MYLICDTGRRPNRLLYWTSNKLKAHHWLELLQEQGLDVNVVEADSEILDTIEEKAKQSEEEKDTRLD